METLYAGFANDPMQWVGAVFAVFGALGIMFFLGGFFGGVAHLFTFSENADHLTHTRARVVWGLYLCMATLGWWEAVRVVFGDAPAGYLWVSLVLLTPFWIPLISRLLKGGGGGH